MSGPSSSQGAPSLVGATPADTEVRWQLPPGPSKPPGRSRRRTGVLVGSLVAVVVIVVVASLFASGAIKLSTGTNSGTAGELVPASSSALDQANGAAAGTSGGPWEPFAVVGLASAVGTLLPESALVSAIAITGCTATWIGGGAESLVLPATPPLSADGTAAAWLVAYLSSPATYPTSVLVVAVTNGSAQSILLLTAGDCALAGIAFDPLTSFTGLANSTTAVLAANNAGGSEFLGNQTVATRVFALSASVLTQPTWDVGYTTCGIGENSSVGSTFSDSVDALTGAASAGAVTSGCTGNLSLGSLGVAFGPAGAPNALGLERASLPELPGRFG
ncbi:MAG: hypothetical protein ACREB9_06895 [Thermoplasmata archaeon]